MKNSTTTCSAVINEKGWRVANNGKQGEMGKEVKAECIHILDLREF